MRRGRFLFAVLALAGVGPPAEAAAPPFWSPEGRYAVFPRGDTDFSLTGLFVVDSESANTRLVGVPRFSYGVAPAPAGHRLAVFGSQGVEVRTLGGELVRSFGDAQFRGLSWSSDGTRFVRPDWHARIFAFDVPSGEVRQVTTGEIVDWSPAGDELAVVRRVSTGWNVHVMKADGSEERQLATLSPPTSPYPIGIEWSPDGVSFAVSWYEQVDVIGEGRRTVIPFPGYNRVIWSPTGTRLAIVGLTRTLLVDADGGRPVELPRAEDAAWSPDGTTFFYGDGTNAFAVGAYGGVSGLLGPARRFALSPGGGSLAVVVPPDGSDCFEEMAGLFDLASRNLVSVEICWIGGGPRDDELIGRLAGPDEMDGFSGSDRLYARGGNDLLKGWEGADRLYAGPGRDYVRAGAGRDRVFASDGERDVVDCGPGRDRAVVDRLDSVARNCERVVRR